MGKAGKLTFGLDLVALGKSEEGGEEVGVVLLGHDEEVVAGEGESARAGGAEEAE